MNADFCSTYSRIVWIKVQRVDFATAWLGMMLKLEYLVRKDPEWYLRWLVFGWIA
jgi:hypothetical protein